ncbi:MAG: redox-regulated ATPase YchF [Candidatus Aminicenantaceae bacterium]
MNFTLFGYPKTGKTTLFNLLTGAKIEVKAYDEGIKEPIHRTSELPDSRLEKIWTLYPEKKKISATIDFTDLGGISFGEVKNSVYLNYLRNADGLTHVVRGFSDIQISHPKGKISPEDDIRSMEEELILADLVAVELRLEKLEKELGRKKSPEGEKEKELLSRISSSLGEGKGVREILHTPSEEKLIRSFTFLSLKPLLHMINVDEKDIPLIENPAKFYPFQKEGIKVLVFCGKIETEIMELEEEEKGIYLAEYGLKELSILKFLHASYRLLKAITFYSVGEKEVKAWTIKENTTALQAAGTIHSDIEKGFIRAEIITWEELIHHGSLQAAKEKGAIRLEGKDYIVQDGDVIYFRFAT